MTAIGNKSVAEAATLSFSVAAIDDDADAVTYSSADRPAGSTLDANTGAFSWTPGLCSKCRKPIHSDICSNSKRTNNN